MSLPHFSFHLFRSNEFLENYQLIFHLFSLRRNIKFRLNCFMICNHFGYRLLKIHLGVPFGMINLESTFSSLYSWEMFGNCWEHIYFQRSLSSRFFQVDYVYLSFSNSCYPASSMWASYHQDPSLDLQQPSTPQDQHHLLNKITNQLLNYS